MLTGVSAVMNSILESARAAGFEAFREYSHEDLMKKRSAMAAVAGIASQRDIGECLVGDALTKEIETVFTLKLFGKVCSYSDGYSLEDKTSQVFEELALTGDLLSRVTKLSRMTRNTTLGRLETDIELTVRTLEQEEEEE